MLQKVSALVFCMIHYVFVCVHIYAYIILLITPICTAYFYTFSNSEKNIKVLYFSCVHHIIFELSGILCLAFMLFATQSRPVLCDPMDCRPPGSSAMGFSRQEYWNGLPFPSPGELPHLEINPESCYDTHIPGKFVTI